ncbi:MAG: hypothetical protein HOG99_04585 [Gemmatimonadetes bacterium]|nr:hypothetical protein [Gemmatimonadota bacterium]
MQLKERGASGRALVVGLMGAVFLGVASTYNDMIIKGSGVATWNWTPGAIVVFFLLAGVLNTLVRFVHRPWGLSRGELAVAYFIILLANTLTGRGFSSQILPVLTGAEYYATPENDWASVVQPHLPAWVLPQGKQALWHFYEGSPSGLVPWEAWARPMLWWGIFALALFLTMACIMVILRRQWVENERLAYPMVQLPLAMLADDERDSVLKPLFRNPLMWAGFAIPFVMGSINALHNYFPFVPTVVAYLPSIPILRGMASISLTLSASMVGFSYFVPINIAAGLCFFYLLTTVQRGLWGLVGWGDKEDAMGAYSQYTEPDIIHEAMGGMIVLVVGTLWIGRHHLRDVLRKAFYDADDVDDSDEILSYRHAVLGTIVGLCVMGVWLAATGVPPALVPLLLAVAFIIFIAISRTVAQGGVANMYPPTNPPDFIVSGVGASAIGAKGMGALAISYAWSVDTLILMMSACANGLKLLTEVKAAQHRRLFAAIVAVIILTLSASIGMVILLSYEHGAINLSSFYFNNVSQYPFRFMAFNLGEPAGPNWIGWVHTGIGAVVMTGVMVAQHRFVWWPFHPLGYPVSCVFGGMWFSVFLAMVLKSVIMKYGGPPLFRRLRPFFLGLILGEACVGGFWIAVDYVTGMVGNTLRGIFFG